MSCPGDDSRILPASSQKVVKVSSRQRDTPLKLGLMIWCVFQSRDHSSR